MTKHLQLLGHKINPKRIRRLYRLMDLHAIGPRPNTSKPHKGKGHTVFPYLLRNLEITHPNQVWSLDISALGSEHLSNKSSHAVFKPTVEILSHYTREVWWKGAVKFYTVLSMRRNKQNSLKCTGDRPLPVGRATTESMMRQRSMCRKPLYLMRQPSIKKWLWRNVVSSYGLDVAMRGLLTSVMGFPYGHYPEPPGVKHAI
jgi:hypothetical protein